MKPLSEYTAEQVKEALQWTKQGETFDHICEDVPEAAQHWVREWVKQFEKRFYS